MAVNLKIIADDLGLSNSVNDGIVFLLKEGKINGASLMANGQAFDDAIQKLQNVNEPNIGVHFVLVEERPLTDTKLPKDHREFFIKYILGLIKLEDIEKELMAQLNKLMQAGIRPQFINSHQHLHLLPKITDMIIKIALENDISYIRTVNESPGLSGGRLFRKAQLLFLNFLSSKVIKKIKNAGLGCNNLFIGFINAGNLSDEEVVLAKRLAEKYPDKIIELGCHPGYESEELIKKYRHWGNYNWNKELNLLIK